MRVRKAEVVRCLEEKGHTEQNGRGNPNAAMIPAHERRGLLAYRKCAERFRVHGRELRSSEQRSGASGMVCRGVLGSRVR